MRDYVDVCIGISLSIPRVLSYLVYQLNITLSSSLTVKNMVEILPVVIILSFKQALLHR